MIKSLLLAAQFLTIAPIRIKQVEERDLAASLLYFPAVGLLLGLLLMLAGHILIYLGLQAWVVGIVLVFLLIVATGGIHLDGLADTVDALAGGRDREHMLQIMRDPHVGVMGVLSLIIVVLLKIAFLVSLDTHTFLSALPVMCMFSRWSMVFLMFVFPYARQEGKAKVYMQKRDIGIFISSLIITLICALVLMGPKMVIILAVVAVFAYESGFFISRKINGITGDTIGGISEVLEIITLFCIFMARRSGLWLM